MMDLRRRLSRHSADIVMAVLLSAVAFGSPWQVPAILLAIKLNVFALPIAIFVGVFGFPLWAWYVVSLLWLSQALSYAGADVPTVLETCRRVAGGQIRTTDETDRSVGLVGVKRDAGGTVLEHDDRPLEASD